jgi:predicted kinase
MIIVVFGLPGSGKSYFARHLQKKIDASFLNTDMIREELNIKGRYGEETKQRVYDEIKKRTTYHLEMGRNVLVDGTFHKKKRRGDLSD